MKSGICRISVFAILTFGFLGTLQTAASAEGTTTQYLSIMRSSDGAQAQSDKESAIRTEYRDGSLNVLGAPAGYYFQVGNVVANDSAATAKNFIAERRAEFGVTSDKVDFSLRKSRKREGRSYERFQQTYSQIPVFGAEVIIQLNASGGVEYALSDIMRNTNALDNGALSTVPTILAADASYLAIALMAETHPGLQLRSTPPQLMIYRPDVVGNTGATCLVWKLEVTNTSTLRLLVDEIVLVNAHTSGIALHFTNLKSAMNREIYDADSSATATLVRSEGDPATGIADADSCYDLFSDVYNFYYNEHGRDSIDNAGMTMIGVVRYCPDSSNCPYANAGWGGGLMVFGEGYVVDDVTAHEMTHGVTENESGLIYLNESGAINESFSDMWGEWVDLSNSTGTDTPDVKWLLGEDIPGIGAIRNMANPPQFGDPDSKCSPLWYDGPMDNGGVHWNSGVGNKLCYLLTDGGTFKGVPVSGMSIPATADLMYEVQTNLLTSSANYADLHAALTQAAINLGWSSYDRYNLEVACFVTELSACFDIANLPVYIETDPPTPNQMTWEIKPTATGLHHIVMKAAKATDESGVEYYFDCIEDDAFDSMQDGQLYQLGKPGDVKMPEAGKTYTFRVQARDKSANHNATLWSEKSSTMTAATVDNLPPAPGPASAWGAKPRKYIYRRTEETIYMQAGESYDESGLEYFFDCIGTDDTITPMNQLDKTQSTRDYMVDVAKIHDKCRYTFALVIRDKADPNNSLLRSPAVTVGMGKVTPRVLKVPLIYSTIQDAIDIATDGDVVELQANRTYVGDKNRNLDFHGYAITVRSENPQDPAIVASTIIDCQGTQNAGGDHGPRRAFIFQNSEEPNSIVSGLTIINAYAVNNPQTTSPGVGLDARGGAILCENGSSPTISKCVIRDCYAQGQNGEDGSTPINGNRGEDGTIEDPNGTVGGPGSDATDDGKSGGNGYGGAVYCGSESSPFIVECTIENVHAVGGSGGASIGGNGGDGGNGYVYDPNEPIPTDPNLIDTDGSAGGKGGDVIGTGGGGGVSAGGALYFESQSDVKIVNCTILNCSAILGSGGQGGIPGAGGRGGRPNGNGNPGPDGPPGQILGGGSGVSGMANGGAVFIGTDCSIYFSDSTRFENNVADTNGGSVFMASSSKAYFDDCIINGNTAQSGNGGAIYTSANATGGYIACEFGANTSGAAGGAIYISENAVSDCNSCNFSINTSSADGGAVFADKSSVLSFANSVFSGNTSTAGNGGAVCANDLTEIHFTNSQFIENHVSGGGDGGAVYYSPNLNKTATFEVTGCTFRSNTAGIDSDPEEAGAEDLYGNGGAINIDPSWTTYDPSLDISISGCTFSTNGSDTGGAIFAWYTDVMIDNCIFSGNSSEYGGGLFWYMADLTITNSSFDNNLAQNADGPAGAYSGGALYCLDASARVYNSKFAENDAELAGGAISLVGTFAYVAGGTQDLINCLMVENTAVDSGGAVSVVDGAEPYFINCTMAGNKVTGASGSGGAVSCLYYGSSYMGTYVLLENSILWDNQADFGPQAAVGHPLNMYNQFSMLELSYSDIEGGSEEVFLGQPEGNSAVYESGGVIDEDPLFVQVTDPNQVIDRTYYLRQAAAGQLPQSPCVDTGAIAGIYSIDGLAALLGFDVTTRTDHVADSGIMDMGFHYDAALPVLEYTLTTAIYIRDYYPYGTIEDPWSPGTYTLKQGTIVQLVAKPDPGYRVARWIGTDNDQSYELTNTVTMAGNRTVQVEFELAVPKNLYVPESYDTIEDALLAARSGDTIILAPNPSIPYLITNPDGINFEGKNLVITSVDPNDSNIVEQTIIDCQGSRYVSKRAFHFENGESANSVIQGITIQNAFTAVIGRSRVISAGRWPWWDGAVPPPWTEDPVNPNPLPPFRALSGEDGTGDSYGGAVLCENGSSPVIRKCIFKNCTVSGGIGGDGADGLWEANRQNETEDLDSYSGGHSGKGTGNGYGGAIAVISGSSPQIFDCTFEENRATGGWGGIPGNAGRSYNAGRFGWGGNDSEGIAYAVQFGINPEAGYGEGDGHGGAIYIAKGCRPVISQNTFEGNYARPGYVSKGGTRGDGAAYPEPYDADPYAQAGYRIGRDGILINYGTIAGGAIFLEEEANVKIEGCQFSENQAYVVSTYNDSPVATRGGAVFSDPYAVVTISDSVFSENLAGAIYCTTGADLWVEQTEFTQNASYIPPEDSTVTPTGNFDLGGAVTVDPNAAVASVFINCQFLNNASHTGGGAIRTLSDIELQDCVLSGNQSLGNGGAIYSYARVDAPLTHTTSMTIENCEFGGNSAQGLGGAAFVKNVVIDVNDSFWVMNEAFSGGGLRASYSDLTMRGCVVYGNDATGAVAGAHRTVTAEGLGGGLHITDSPFLIENTRIEKNTARGIISSGGGLCITGNQSYYNQSLYNCLFADNHSDNAGGGVSCLLYVNAGFDNCTFANNTSDGNLGGALYVDRLSNITLNNSIVSGNTGIGIYEKPGGNSQADHALFYNNGGGDMHNGSDGIIYPANAAPGYTNITIGDPLFVTGPLDKYYLNQGASPAVDMGSMTAQAAGLHTYTTDPNGMLDVAGSLVDLGYHYEDPTGTLTFNLITSVIDDNGQVTTGTVTPGSGTYLRGAIVELSADVGKDYFLTGWSGGTFSDSSQDDTNWILMSGDKDIKVLVRLRRTLNVGTSSEYDLLGDAIIDAQDGDIILVAPGEYVAGSQFGTMTNSIVLDGKKITIAGYNPNDEAAVRATIFRDFRFIISNVNNQTIIEGITINQSRMLLTNADMILRNCVFSNCRFGDPTSIHTPPVAAGTDGYSQYPITSGALQLWDSSPAIIGCTFENNAVFGIDGENGYAGAQSHPTGGDGGWPGGAYGGAVYCGFSSSPEFIGCTFTGNEVFGGDGGNGANGWVNMGTIYDGGRGGGWVYDQVIEDYLINTRGWDGWTNNAYGDKYGIYSIYYDFYGAYDLDLWAKWFNWGDSYFSWEQFEADYLNDPYDPLGDPYDQMQDVWRYSGYGGAVYCEFKSGAKFTDCVFENNQSHGGLTGIGGYQEDETSWPDRQLNMPTAGGAVFAANDSDVEFTNCQFLGNTADTSTVELPHTFQVSFGGAVAYQFDCNVKFTNCDLSENNATVGGAVYGFETNTVITDCNVFGNEAYIGAGVYSEDYDLRVTSTTFRSNRAVTPAALTPPAESLELTGEAGGLYAMIDTLDIRDSVFMSNSADISGAGLLLAGVATRPTNVFNCLFVNNTAGHDGAGASVNWGHQAKFGNCTFADNEVLGTDGVSGSGGGLYCATDSKVEVIDSIFWGNTALLGNQLAVTSETRPSTLTVSYCDVQGGMSETYVESGCTLNWNTASVISGDPLFVASTTGDYYLSQINAEQPNLLQDVNSPCLNAGSDLAINLGLNYYTTATVPLDDSGKVDIGYHYPGGGSTGYYTLNLSHIGDGTITPSPQAVEYAYGTEVTLTATPDSGYRVKKWTGTDDDFSLANQNKVVMTSNRTVSVEFEAYTAKIILVPSSYATIEEAVNAAFSGDTIILSPRSDMPYTISATDGIDFRGKSIVLTSIDPTNAQVVASTIIDCQGTKFTPKRAFYFHSGEDSNTIIKGITVLNAYSVGMAGASGAVIGELWPPDPTVNTLSVLRANGGQDVTGNGYGGAVLCENSSSPIFQNCIFAKCTVAGGVGGDGSDGFGIAVGGTGDAQSGGLGGSGSGFGYGGVVACLKGSNPLFEGCSFTGNKALGGIGGDGGNGGSNLGTGHGSWGGGGGNSIGDGMGGVVYTEDRSNPSFVRCVFEGNYATNVMGGSVGSSGNGSAYSEPYDDFGDFTSAGIYNIYGVLAGGAVYAATNSSPKFTDCSFTQNEAYETIPATVGVAGNQKYYTHGGAMYFANNNTAKLVNCSFTGNLGGAVYCSEGNTFETEGCIFTGNKAIYSDEVEGQSYTAEQLLTVPETGYYYYQFSGGALFVDRGCSVVLKSTQFRNNSSLLNGGAIRTRSSIQLSDCNIDSNKAGLYGGGIAIFSDLNTLAGETEYQTVTLTFEDCLFGGNMAIVGGGVHTKHVTVQGSDSYVMGNAADEGGGLYLTESQITFTNGIMNGNQATARYGFGGAIAGMNTKLAIENIQFGDNTADGTGGYGGSIYISGCGALSNRDTFHTIKNCLFSGNTSGQGGGAVATTLYTSPTMQNCTFDKNTSVAGGAVFCDWSSTAKLLDSIVTDSQGDALYDQNYDQDDSDPDVSKINLQYTLFYNNMKYDLYNSGFAKGYTGAAQLNGIAGNAGNRDGNPLFAVGGLGAYLLGAGSPAIDVGSGSASDPNIGMASYTTQSDGTPDSGQVDMGYHYAFDALSIPKVTLTILVDGGHAAVTANPLPDVDGKYFAGTAVTLTITPDSGYRVASWSGNTVNDSSKQLTNTVIMGTTDRTIVIQMEVPRTLTVGSLAQYTSIQAAIDDAEEGDVVIIQPGRYQPTSTGGLIDGTIWSLVLSGKNITLTGTNPDDSDVVANTVISGYMFSFTQVGPETVINGLTISSGVRGATPVDPIGTGVDGSDGTSIKGGAMRMFYSSPTIKNCIFRDCWAEGGDAANGTNGGGGHPTGGDGGWPGRGYGGAVYCAYSSNPQFLNCSFIGCSARGGNGGNGGNGATIDNEDNYGGRGGGWTWAPSIEQTNFSWWDGWTYGDKWDYGDYGYGVYDWNTWLKWFDWDKYYNWDDWYNNYYLGGSTDPYDLYNNYWEYSGYGGAVYCEYDSSPRFVRCRFEDNYTEGGLCGIGGDYSGPEDYRYPGVSYNIENAGGAVFAHRGSNLSFEECTFIGNYADNSLVNGSDDYYISYGGAVAYEYDCDVTLKDCLLENNRACMGGGVYWLESHSAITDCNFIDNRAYDGGGIYITNSTGDILRTNIESNITTYDLQIGTTWPTDAEDYIVGSGGGIYTVNALTNIRDSVFKANTASLSGGAIAYTGSDGDILKQSLLWNSLLIHNTAGCDGGAVSIDWYAETSVGNCTFANNEATGSFGSTMESYGGGLSVNYESNTNVVNSIFWDNTASHGNQFAVTSGFELDPRPSTLTVSYCDVQGGRSSMSVYSEDGCRLNWDDASVLSVNPLFLSVYEDDYHLSQYNAAYDVDEQQENSPCVNAGSGLASDFGLEYYTTASPIPLEDTKEVDLGYHYVFRLTAEICPYADLRDGGTQFLDGIVDTKDLSLFAQWWLDDCGATNLWCDLADFNRNGGVDFLDFVRMANCWQTEDTEAPSQAKWDMQPTPFVKPDSTTIAEANRQMYYPDTSSTTAIGYHNDMSAMESTDNWIGGLFYKFEAYDKYGVLDTNPNHTSYWMQNFDPNLVIRDGNKTVEDNEIIFIAKNATDPNIVPWKWQSIQLVDQHDYVYKIRIRDSRGMALADGSNETVSAPPDPLAKAGDDWNPPTPNPATWDGTEGRPRQVGTTIVMTATEATDNGEHGVRYYFVCLENSALSTPTEGIASRTYTVPGVGQPALENGQTYTFQVKYRDTSDNHNETGYSVAVSVIFGTGDIDPPIPNPTTLVALWFYDNDSGQWYHNLTAGVVTDASGFVQYKFRCVDLPGLVPDTWYNVNTLSVPVGGVSDHTYQVQTQDLYENAGLWSDEYDPLATSH